MTDSPEIIFVVLFNKVDHRCSFFCALGLCSISFILQLIMIERSSIPESWLEPELNESVTEMESHNFKDMQKVLDVEGGLWSKSSSMSTINLRDQPVIFEKESESNYSHAANINKKMKNYIICRLVTSVHLISMLYQIIILGAVLGAVEVNQFIIILDFLLIFYFHPASSQRYLQNYQV